MCVHAWSTKESSISVGCFKMVFFFPSSPQMLLILWCVICGANCWSSIDNRVYMFSVFSILLSVLFIFLFQVCVNPFSLSHTHTDMHTQQPPPPNPFLSAILGKARVEHHSLLCNTVRIVKWTVKTVFKWYLATWKLENIFSKVA